LYFLGLSLRNVVKAWSYLHIVKRSHVSIWKFIQKFHYQKTSSTRRKKISEYIVDETILKVGSEFIWLWIAIEPENRLIRAQNITQDRNMFVAERFVSDLVKSYGKHPVSTDEGTWYPMACQFLKLKHHIHYSYEKSMIKRKMHYIKDRTKVSMITFHVRWKNVN
jgi:putative transposase